MDIWGDHQRKTTPLDCLNPSHYADRLGALVDPSAVLLVRQRSTEPEVSMIDDIIATGEGGAAMSERSGIRISGRGTAMAWPVEQGPVIRVPLTPRARIRCQLGHEALEALHKCLPIELKGVLPTSSCRVYSSKISVYSEPLMPGTPGFKELPQETIDSALEWLANLHVGTYNIATNPKSEAGRALQKRLAELVELGDIILEKHQAQTQQARWNRLKEAILNPPWESGVALCTTHGDFHIRNLLFAEDRLSGVIDWETAASMTLPIRDVFWFALSCRVVGQHATAEVYKRDLLGPKPPVALRAYYQTVDDDIWRSLWHPWSRLVYPLERLKTVWDGYELAGVVEPNPMAADWVNLVASLARFQEREGLLRKSR